MATVKLQNGKIVTKNNKVSCSCCEGERFCCIYPATCSKGPDQIYFYGEILNEDPVNSQIYGTLENGLKNEDGVWAIYRTPEGGQTTRTEIDCLRYNTGNVYPIVSTAYNLNMVLNPDEYENPNYTSLLTLAGGLAGPPNDFCFWGGVEEPYQQIFDEGIYLYFNQFSCRWEIAIGPELIFAGYKSGPLQGNPSGVYTIASIFQSLEIT